MIHHDLTTFLAVHASPKTVRSLHSLIFHVSLKEPFALHPGAILSRVTIHTAFSKGCPIRGVRKNSCPDFRSGVPIYAELGSVGRSFELDSHFRSQQLPNEVNLVLQHFNERFRWNLTNDFASFSVYDSSDDFSRVLVPVELDSGAQEVDDGFFLLFIRFFRHPGFSEDRLRHFLFHAASLGRVSGHASQRMSGVDLGRFCDLRLARRSSLWG